MSYTDAPESNLDSLACGGSGARRIESANLMSPGSMGGLDGQIGASDSGTGGTVSSGCPKPKPTPDGGRVYRYRRHRSKVNCSARCIRDWSILGSVNEQTSLDKKDPAPRPPAKSLLAVKEPREKRSERARASLQGCKGIAQEQYDADGEMSSEVDSDTD
jgi:hypothetical protein